MLVGVKVLQSSTNVPLEALIAQQRRTLSRGVPTVADLRRMEYGRPLLIAGGGPSLADTFDPVGWRQWDVMALNGTAKWLLERGFTPRYHVLVDGQPRVADYVPDDHPPGMEYLLAGMCHDDVWAKVQGRPVRAWFTYPDKEHSPPFAIGGGNTVGLRAITLGHVLGYNEIDVHGFDSSYRDGVMHAYGDRPDLVAFPKAIWCDLKPFRASGSMIFQVENFFPTVGLVEAEGTTVNVHGSGLLPSFARLCSRLYQMQPEERQAEIERIRAETLRLSDESDPTVMAPSF